MKTLPLERRILMGMLAIAASAGSLAAAGPGLSVGDRMELGRPAMTQKLGWLKSGKAKAAATTAPAVRYAIVQLAPGHTADELEAEGVSVTMARGDIALCAIMSDEVARVAELDCVDRFELSRVRGLQMDKAREACGVAKAHAGTGLDQPYTGKGVVAGVVDQGIQPKHANFRNADGTTRFKYLSHIYAASNQYGYSTDYYGSDVSGAKDLDDFETDTYTTYHGSHTLGILGGCFDGNIKTGSGETANPYNGVAPGVDLAASYGETNDMFIALGLTGIADYADATGKPAVISMSLGSNTASHSPKSMMNTIVDMVAADYPVVISAGNEGDIPLASRKTLTSDDRELKTFIRSSDAEYPNMHYGTVYIYSDKMFELKGVIVNKSRGKISSYMPASENLNDYVTYSTTDVGGIQCQGKSMDDVFTQSYVAVGMTQESYTQEYIGVFDYAVMNNAETNADGNYVFGFVVTGEPGQRIEAYCDGLYSYLYDYGVEGWDTGTTDGTINDMACGLNTISVGSFNTRSNYPLLAGGVARPANFDFTDGQMTPYSSYASFPDRESLPHVCAPGAVIVSSYNGEYVKSLQDYSPDDAELTLVASHTASDGTVSYWGPSHGTSMATPYVAGGIALWLEAYPQLTVPEIKDIIKKTAVKDDQVNAGIPAQWGAGKFDAYAGLQEAIRMRTAGIESAIADEADLMVKGDGRTFEFFLGGAEVIKVDLWNLDGRRVASASANGDEVTLDASGLTAGVYIARVNDNISKRIIVK